MTAIVEASASSLGPLLEAIRVHVEEMVGARPGRAGPELAGEPGNFTPMTFFLARKPA